MNDFINQAEKDVLAILKNAFADDFNNFELKIKPTIEDYESSKMPSLSVLVTGLERAESGETILPVVVYILVNDELAVAETECARLSALIFNYFNANPFIKNNKNYGALHLSSIKIQPFDINSNELMILGTIHLSLEITSL